jgi:hypothetical protein
LTACFGEAAMDNFFGMKKQITTDFISKTAIRTSFGLWRRFNL